MRKLTGAALLILAFSTGTSQAATISWADWTASDLASATGTAGGVSLAFRGTLRFAQLASGVMVGGGANPNTDYWIQGAPAPYTGNALVDNRPPGFELLAFNAASSNTLTFGSAVTNPLMAIVSMGQPGFAVSYDFDTPFTVLSEGRGFWGDGTFTTSPVDVLTGRELHAVIQFSGTVSAINWTSTQENWHGFTIGLVGVPEPTTLLLLGLGLIGVGFARKRLD